MDIQEDEIEIMLKDLKWLFDQDENKELIETLKAYLDCKMNYSHTAKQLYININTVRKRIDQINDKIQIRLRESFKSIKVRNFTQVVQLKLNV